MAEAIVAKVHATLTAALSITAHFLLSSAERQEPGNENVQSHATNAVSSRLILFFRFSVTLWSAEEWRRQHQTLARAKSSHSAPYRLPMFLLPPEHG